MNKMGGGAFIMLRGIKNAFFSSPNYSISVFESLDLLFKFLTGITERYKFSVF